MIKVKLLFGNSKNDGRQIEIDEGELLHHGVDRVLDGIPLGKFKPEEVFNVVVNGKAIDKEFWEFTKLQKTDTVILSPKIASGDSGQIFKQLVILTVAIIATVYLGPEAGAPFWSQVGSAMAVAAITIGATLLMNGLIPPPVPALGESGLGGGGIEESQMYTITGQSNQMKRLGTVPKVYGSHRIFPTVAAVPYTEISVDPATGETVQYLYAIYDFGLGTMKLADLQIGDTPLTKESFADFEIRLVDPMAPTTPADEFDENLFQDFTTYKSKRVVTPLSFAYNDDGTEFIQNSDDNSEAVSQEILVDLVAPAGLYGFSSSGTFGERSVLFHLDFQLVGDTNWRPYNDLDYVDHYSSVGGTDVTDFDLLVAALSTTNPLYSTYYETVVWNTGTYNGINQFNAETYIKRATKKLLFPVDARLQVGGKIFYGTRFLGVIESLTTISGPYTEVTLDRVASWDMNIPVFQMKAVGAFGGGVSSYGDPFNIHSMTISRHELSAAVMVGSKQTPVYGSFRFTPKVPGQYRVRLKRISASGNFVTQKADSITWGAITTALKVPPVNTNKRHLFLELKIKATNQLNGHIQNLSAVASSVLPVYDPDTETWTRQVTNNPAWVFCDLLTGEVNKKAVPISRLHLDSIVEWAEYCDTIPTPPPSATYLEPRFQTNFVLDYQSTLQEVIGQVAGAAQASLNVIDGKYGVLVDKYKNTPVQIFTTRNSKDFKSTRLYGPRPHGVKVKYIDPQLNWEIAETVAYDNGYNEDNATELDELTSFACTNHEQAWRFGRYMIAQNKLRQETISILVDFENLVCTRGDYVQITQDVMRVGGTPARVQAIDNATIKIDDALDIDPLITYGYVARLGNGDVINSTCTPVSAREFTLDGDIPSVGDLIIIGEVGRIVYDCIVKSISPNDDMSAILTLVEKADGIFEFESSDVLPDYDPQISQTSNPQFKPPLAVTNLVVEANTWRASDTQSGYEYYIDLSWDIPLGSVYEFFEIWVNDGLGYSKYDTTTKKKFRYLVDQLRLGIEHGFKVVAVSASGKKLELIAMTEVLATPETKTDPPSDVESFTLSITNQVLQLSWGKIDDEDVKEYVIRFSPDTNDVWESSVPLVVIDRALNSTALQARTGVYMIKAIDFAGNQSENAARAVTTIPSLFDLNIIETMNEAPEFPGVKTDIEILGEAVILTEQVPGDVDTVQYYSRGFYEFSELLDLDDIYSVRLQSQIRADGLKKGELMSEWEHLSEVEHLNTALHSDWDVKLQYRATDVFSSMADWEHLSDVDHLNFGAGVGFTEWRDIPTTGDATGRLFQFGVELRSLTPNVTPRVFDATVKADMPDRQDSDENLISSATEDTEIVYDPVFKGPGTSPNVQITIDNAQTGDYWVFGEKTLEGFTIRFYDKDNNQVSRQFDYVAKGFGRKHTSLL